MSWIKRNLYFLIGSVVSLALLGVSVWYLFSKMQLNNQKLEELNGAYAELEQLASKKPNPGNEKVDNTKIAKDQQAQASVVLEKVRKFFVPIPRISESTNISDQEFANALRNTVDRLQRDAAKSGIALPPRYNFSFEAQRPLVRFAPDTLQTLAVQLAEARTIIEILLAGKINALDNVRRERISDDDLKGPQSDYLEERSVTNDLAVVSPYETTFRCFSSELAGVLAGFANSPHGIVVRTVNVDSGGTMGALVAGTGEGIPGYPPMAYQPMPGYPMPMGGQPQPAAPGTPGAAPQLKRGGLPIVLDEKQLKVTLSVNIIKFLPPTH
jgi:hypothetical protein